MPAHRSHLREPLQTLAALGAVDVPARQLCRAPTNNDAERALRSIVIKRKVSGPRRSRRGNDFIARDWRATAQLT